MNGPSVGGLVDLLALGGGLALLGVAFSSSHPLVDGDGRAVERYERHGLTWVVGDPRSLGVVLGGTAGGALAARGAAWVACGPMFDGRGPRFLLADRRGGVAWASREPTRGATVAVYSSGLVREVAGAALPAGEAPAVAVQGYPELVRRGAAVAVAESERERRVALAVLASSLGPRVALVALQRGTMQAFVEALVAGGAVEAVYLDGGRAAHLAPVDGAAVLAHTSAEVPRAWVTLGWGS